MQDEIENDVNELEGKPFTARNVAEMFGNQAAAISVLIKIVESLIEGNIKNE